MLGTKTMLNPINALFSKVHHPPPLNQRESQRLLKALTASFRKNLDKEHGYWSEDTSPAFSSIPSLASTTSSPSPSPATSTDDAHRRPTDRHVRAILSNPLFSYDPAKATQRLPTNRDPMDVFDQAVAKGLMNPQRAAGVLIAKRQAIAQSSSVSVNESMANSGTALRVLQWLRSSGLERDLNFITCQPLIDHLVLFMVEERLEEVAWIWLERWMRGEGPVLPSRQNALHASHLLSRLVRAKITPGTTLDNGYASMIRADDMFRDLPNFEATAIGPWRGLSTSSTVFAWQRSQPSEALFDSFAAISGHLRKWQASVQVDRAHLDLHHPTHPDATLAINYLKSPIPERLQRGMLEREHQANHEAAKTIVKRIVLMATDAAQHLSRIGQEADAEWVRNLVLDKFGDYLRRELSNAGLEFQIFQHGQPTV